MYATAHSGVVLHKQRGVWDWLGKERRRRVGGRLMSNSGFVSPCKFTSGKQAKEGCQKASFKIVFTLTLVCV